MKEPKLTDQAKVDLDEIWYTIASNRDERTADRFTAKIYDKCRSHAQFRESGRLRAELSLDLWSFPVNPYVVFYIPSEDTISILRILHGHRDIKQIMGRKDRP